MSDHFTEDLDPTGRDLREFTDQLRPEHAVVRNVRGEYVVLRHADVVAVAEDAERFSSGVSRFLQVPNGLDGAEHRAARQALDRYFDADAIAPYAEAFRQIARELVASAPLGQTIDAVHDIGAVFAVRGQSAWLGWPAELEPALLTWMGENHAASRSGDRARTAKVAEDFNAIIRSVLEPRRALGDAASDDVTTELMNDQIDGRPFTDDELVSVLRNWTGGDLGSIALCVGVLCSYLAERPELQAELVGASDDDLDAAIDEILRIDDPFVTNRRKAVCPAHVGGVEVPEGAVIKLNWTSANRDEQVFGDPDRYDPHGNADKNIVYGVGPHICPGRPLATMELRIALRELLAARVIAAAPDAEAVREVSPVGGFNRVPIVLRERQASRT